MVIAVLIVGGSGWGWRWRGEGEGETERLEGRGKLFDDENSHVMRGGPALQLEERRAILR